MSLVEAAGDGYQLPRETSVETYLANDGWLQILPRTTRTIVSSSVLKVVDAPIGKLVEMAQELDGERDENPYLRREEPLADSYRGIHDYFDRNGSWMTDEAKTGAIKKIFQITLVERMIGARIAETSEWPRRRTGLATFRVRRAMDVGKRAVRRFAK